MSQGNERSVGRDVATVAVPCPDCGEMSIEPVARLLENDVIPCSVCGGLIDLSAESCQAALAEARARA